MYPNYNIRQNYVNYPSNQNFYRNNSSNDDRLLAGGLVAPFLLGGLAGYAIGRPNYYQSYPYNYYYNNFYYPPYYW